MDRDIQPRTVPEILDAGFTLYRRHFWLLIGLSFATTLPLPGSDFRAQIQANPRAAFGPLLTSMLVTMVLSTIKSWLVVAALSEAMLGRRVTLKATVDRLLPVVPWLVFRTIWFGIVTFLASLLLLVPGVLVYVAWLFYPMVVIVEGRRVPAFRRSADLTREQRGRVGILVTLLALLSGSLSLAFTVMSHMMRWDPAEQIMSYLSLLVLGPLQPAILLVAYFDLRARNEGLDLKLRSQALDVAPPGAATVVGAA